MLVIDYDCDTFNCLVETSHVPVVCDFYADWCGPCKMLAPIMEELAEQYRGDIAFIKVNVDKVPELAIKFGIMSIPLIMMFKDGKLVKKQLGFTPKAELEAMVKELL